MYLTSFRRFSVAIVLLLAGITLFPVSRAAIQTLAQGGPIPLALPDGTLLLPATLVTTVDTSSAAWNPFSPDPSGIAYSHQTGRLLVVDSEVEEEEAFWQGANVFQATTSGALDGTCTTFTSTPVSPVWNNYSREPTGIAINPANNFVYISDDSGNGRVHEVNPGADGTYCTSDDLITTILFASDLGADVKDVAYGDNTLFIAGGNAAEVYMWDLGADGVLGGGDDGPITSFDTLSLGFTDPEAIAYNWDRDTLFIISTTSSERYLGEVTTSGTLLHAFDLTFMGSGGTKRHGMTYAPGSQNPSVWNIYIVSQNTRLADDGQWWEVLLSDIPTTPTNTPTSTATSTPTGTATNTPTNTPTGTATNTPTNTPTGTLTSTPTNTPTGTATNTPTNTPTGTATNTPTSTATPEATEPPDEETIRIFLPMITGQ